MTNACFTLSALDEPQPNDRASTHRSEAQGAEKITISIHTDIAVLEAEWRALDENGQNSLHQSFDWCAAWRKTHKGQTLFVRAVRGQQTLFILPFEIDRRRFFRTARLIGSDHSNLNTGLFADEDATPPMEVMSVLTCGIKRQLRGLADIVTLDKTPATWRGKVHPLAALPALQNANASFQLPLLGNIERTLAQLNAKRRRRKMRISERRLAALGGYDYVVARETSEAHALLETFFQQKAARFEAHGLPDVFQDAETRAFFHQLVERGQTVDGRLLELNAIRLKGEHEDRILAIAGLSRKGDHVICQFGSIDEGIAADSSPGELLFYRIIERLCSDGVALFDFGIGDQPYKRSWCTIETPLRDIVLPVTLRGHLAARIHLGAMLAKRLIKANKASYAFVQRLRQRRQQR
ncbi:GNAT family N-acetyltransferase [Sinorhizobium garamanticum]|uniref:GNAT family N-acetyltransferase n=1 Tax=Sinorhizobium garamanticum TaxID=680247 RepID=A0ABY8DER3_9HYPH|nr:GNAT family N-acetyltransferase [Sinorhizobium garamanticum]WEX87491.1 GNAT family N-acetyltransferase [Sinorhizobium garamanticum]